MFDSPPGTRCDPSRWGPLGRPSSFQVTSLKSPKRRCFFPGIALHRLIWFYRCFIFFLRFEVGFSFFFFFWGFFFFFFFWGLGPFLHLIFPIFSLPCTATPFSSRTIYRILFFFLPPCYYVDLFFGLELRFLHFSWRGLFVPFCTQSFSPPFVFLFFFL